MGVTYADLLDHLVSVRDAEYRSDPEREDAIKGALLYVMQAVLEKLRDKFDTNR